MKDKKDKKPAPGDKKVYSAGSNSESDSSLSEEKSYRDDEEINAYHMRIVRNSGYGYPMTGCNVYSVTNQSLVYHVRIDHGAAVHGEKSVESYASMQDKHKAFVFTMDPGCEWKHRTLEGRSGTVRDNGGYSSVVGISVGNTPITHVGYMDPTR